MKKFNFQFKSACAKKARLGKITTPHGFIKTPAFIFCATKAAIKGLSVEDMREAGTQIILSNTYHLMLQPGYEIVHKMGGLQQFTAWRGPMLTDSGGFQIFSLGHGSVAHEIKGKKTTSRPKTLLKISEEGALFKSYWDGRKWLLTPEFSIFVQHRLGADLIVVLDECTPFHVDESYTKASMDRSHRWAVRSLNEFNKLEIQNQRLYGIIQGGIYPHLREEACNFINSQPFFGHAIGGSLGASKQQMYEVIAMVTENLEQNRPIHLLGIGGVRDIFNGVEQGIDTFDCVHPTRLARHGGALVKPVYNTDSSREHINLKSSKYRLDNSPIEPDCLCRVCQNYTRAYIHHLIKVQELLAYSLITFHNVYFMNHLMASIREGLENNTYSEVKTKWLCE